MEEIRNRNLGEVYTPNHVSKLLFELTNKYIPNFNKTHTVWDSCWGTGNLTSRYEFDDLYCSTLRMMDIRRHQGKNKGAIKFAYNFLEEDIEQLISQQAMWVQQHKMPEELVEKLDGNKPFLFYINPPYVATGVYGTNNTDFKEEATSNAVKNIMREQSLGSACDQTYCQFLYRIYLMREAYKNKKMSIAVICPPIYLSGITYGKFREKFLKDFKFMGGALFKANEFEGGLSDRWGISIQIWTAGETEDKKNFEFDLYEKNSKGELECFGKKVIYNLDGEVTCVDWIKELTMGVPQKVAEVTLSSGCKVSNKKKVNTAVDSLGYFFYKGNNIYHNEQECGMMTLPYSDGSGVTVSKENFDCAVATFTARRSYSRYGANWMNDKDEYAKPDIHSEAFKKLLYNGYIYVLFNGASHMSSLILDTENGRYDAPNHFHFIGIEEMKPWFEEAGIGMTGPGKLEDRFMYYKVQQALSSGLLVPQAYKVYEEAIRLWKETVSLRAEFNKKEPMYQVMNWDAGFYQVKQIIKDRNTQDFLDFNIMYRAFEESIRPLIHECGYLR